MSSRRTAHHRIQSAQIRKTTSTKKRAKWIFSNMCTWREGVGLAT
jgi:hypothetical protein